MIKLFGVAVVLLVLVVLALAATKPASFRVERSIAINAPPEKVLALITDFRAWAGWSPWETLDPGMKKTYTGAQTGKGAVYAWDGANSVGSGRMEITEVAAPSKVLIKLDFLRPFEAHNITEFSLASAGGVTTLSWAMYGPTNFMTKVMSVFCSMDKMVGKDFAKGLASLKALAEK